MATFIKHTWEDRVFRGDRRKLLRTSGDKAAKYKQIASSTREIRIFNGCAQTFSPVLQLTPKGGGREGDVKKRNKRAPVTFHLFFPGFYREAQYNGRDRSPGTRLSMFSTPVDTIKRLSY